MTEKRFEQFVRELEAYAKAHPAQYKLKVALLAFVGYAYVLAVLGTVIALTIGCFALITDSSGGHALLFKAGIALIVLATVIIRALWVRLDPPTGIELRREHAPRLFLLIDKIRTALGTPPFHHVLIVNELNAAVVQVPRLGILGWQRNYLLLGLPLMLTFTPAQFQAVLAHEFGHLGRQHGRFFTWIYRARVIWSQLLQEMTARQHWASFVFTKFLGWYAPFFNAYSFVMAREQEYEADRNAAHLVGPHCMKDTLAGLSVVGRLLQESFWSSLDRRNRETANPPDGYLHDLAQTILIPAHRDRIARFFDEAMHDKTGYADTHPSLADRLAALSKLPEKKTSADVYSTIPQLLGAEQEHAARYYLGKTCDNLCAQFNREWAEHIKETWTQRYDDMQAAHTRMTELKEKSTIGLLTDDELWEYATKAELVEGEEAAIGLFRQLSDRLPEHAGVNFALGRLLLAQGDRSGLERLELAAVKNPEAFLAAAALAEDFLVRTGQDKEAAMYRERALEHRDMMVAAEEERQRIEPDDLFLPHNLPDDAVQALATDLSAIEEIGEAYLTRKQVRVMPDIPAYVLIVIPQYRWYEWREEAKNEALVTKLSQEIALPSNTYILVLGSQVKRRWEKRGLTRIPPLALRPGLSDKAVAANSAPRTTDSASLEFSWLSWVKRRWLECLVVGVVLALFSNFSAHPEPNCSNHPTGFAQNSINSRTLYLVPIGNFPDSTLARLTAHYANAWHIPVTTLPSLPEDESLWDPSRDQLVAERVVDMMKQQLAELASSPDTILIGLTAQDMYREESSWGYAFSHREDNRYAIVSSARMHPQALPLHFPHGPLFSLDQLDADLAQCRLTKMVGKNIGVMYYQLEMNEDPTSMLYSNIGGPDDLDRITERF